MQRPQNKVSSAFNMAKHIDLVQDHQELGFITPNIDSWLSTFANLHAKALIFWGVQACTSQDYSRHLRLVDQNNTHLCSNFHAYGSIGISNLRSINWSLNLIQRSKLSFGMQCIDRTTKKKKSNLSNLVQWRCSTVKLEPKKWLS